MYYIKPQSKDGFFIYQINYIKVSPSSGCYVSASKDDYQGIVINGTPYSSNKNNPLPDAEVVDVIGMEDWSEEIKNLYNNLLCEQAKKDKLSQLSIACNDAINNGMEIQLSNGSKELFSYNIEDQSNISEMFNAVLMGAVQYPYHSNNNPCKMYSANDIITIYTNLSGLKTSQITYHNLLKQYVKTLESPLEIYKVEYGQELTGEFLENYNLIMNQANDQMQNIISKISQ